MRAFAAKSPQCRIVERQEPPYVLSLLTVRVAFDLAVDRHPNSPNARTDYQDLPEQTIYCCCPLPLLAFTYVFIWASSYASFLANNPLNLISCNW
jgi:hypothetical protein